jgi:hypothetical protein
LGLRIKNVILKDFNITDKGLSEGLDIIHRKQPNGENYATLTGTKQQINHYLQDKPTLSDRLRTLNNLPKFRIINTTKERIY